MELAVRGALDSMIDAVTLQAESERVRDREQPARERQTEGDGTTEKGSEEMLCVNAVDDKQGEDSKQLKRLDALLAPYDRRRQAMERQKDTERTTMSQLQARLRHKQHSEAMARRRDR